MADESAATNNPQGTGPAATDDTLSGSRPDWEGIERDFRAGQVSIREVARTHRVTEGAIRKRAKAHGWKRALAEKVRAAVQEQLVRDPGTQDGTQSDRVRTDAEIVAEKAEVGAAVIRRHRKDAGRAASVVAKLIDELEAATDHQDDIGDAIVDDTRGDTNGKRRAMMLRAVELPSRAQTAAALSVAMKNLIGVERRAFNLDEPGQSGGTTHEAALAALE